VSNKYLTKIYRCVIIKVGKKNQINDKEEE